MAHKIPSLIAVAFFLYGCTLSEHTSEPNDSTYEYEPYSSYRPIYQLPSSSSAAPSYKPDYQLQSSSSVVYSYQQSPSSSSQTNTPLSSSSVKTSSVSISSCTASRPSETCQGSTLDKSKEFCNDGIVDTYCHTSLYTPTASCYSGSDIGCCEGFPYNPKYFTCSGGSLKLRCGVSYFGHWFFAVSGCV